MTCSSHLSLHIIKYEWWYMRFQNQTGLTCIFNFGWGYEWNHRLIYLSPLNPAMLTSQNYYPLALPGDCCTFRCYVWNMHCNIYISAFEQCFIKSTNRQRIAKGVNFDTLLYSLQKQTLQISLAIGDIWKCTMQRQIKWTKGHTHKRQVRSDFSQIRIRGRPT